MPRYQIVATAFKPSGKMYNTGKTVDLGLYLEYPAGKIRTTINEMYENLDEACGLVTGCIKTNAFVVLIQVLDDTNNPIVYQELVV